MLAITEVVCSRHLGFAPPILGNTATELPRIALSDLARVRATVSGTYKFTLFSVPSPLTGTFLTIMKDEYTPLATPFYLAHSLTSPNRLSERRSDYFEAIGSNTVVSPDSIGISSFPLWKDIEANFLKPKHLVSPFDTLPNEILSVIIEQGYFENNGCNDKFRDLTGLISHRWREVTIHTPSVWSVVSLSQSNIHTLDTLPISLERSKDHPLDIYLNCFWNPALTDTIMDILIPHSRRWHHLSITTPNNGIFTCMENVSVPHLQSLKLSHFSPNRNITLQSPIFQNSALPELSHLLLRNISLQNSMLPVRLLTTLEIRGYGMWPTYGELDEAIGGSTSLERLIVHIKPADALADIHPQNRLPISLPALRTFEVYTSEWLSRDIASFIRLFSYPNLQNLSVQDIAGSTWTTPGLDIVRYTAPPRGDSNMASLSPQPQPPKPSKLSVWASNMYYASIALCPGIRLKELELRAAVWPKYPELAEMFSLLPVLEKLVILEINPMHALRDIENTENLPPIKLPFLRVLEISMVRTLGWEKAVRTSIPARFACLFSLPALEDLTIRNILEWEWTDLLHAIIARDSLCSLRSLSLSNISDILPCKPSAAEAFPALQHLSLSHVGSNIFIQHLIQEEGDKNVWPRLQMISISGDANASKPLLHKALAARKAMGRPLQKLHLDSYFKSNVESWEWLKGEVDVEDLQADSDI